MQSEDDERLSAWRELRGADFCFPKSCGRSFPPFRARPRSKKIAAALISRVRFYPATSLPATEAGSHPQGYRRVIFSFTAHRTLSTLQRFRGAGKNRDANFGGCFFCDLSPFAEGRRFQTPLLQVRSSRGAISTKWLEMLVTEARKLLTPVPYDGLSPRTTFTKNQREARLAC